MERIDRFVDQDRFARHLGIDVVEYGDGWAKTCVGIEGNHLNSAGIVHGGLIFALADAAFSIASNSHGSLSVAIAAGISYFKAESQGTLYAKAREVSLGPKLATYSIDVTNENEDAVALFHGTVYRKSSRVDTETD